MTVVIIAGVLTFAVGLLILRPFPGKGGRPQVRGHDTADDRRRELLRQLRDLDDDLAAGKLTAGDHARLREPVEREAAAVLRRKAQGPADGIGAGQPGTPSGPATPGPRQGRAGPWGTPLEPPDRDAAGTGRRRGRRRGPARGGGFRPAPRADDHGQLGGRGGPGGGQPGWPRLRPRGPAASSPPASRPPASSWPRWLRRRLR